MLILNLTRGNSGMRVPLRLPATPGEIGEAYSKLDEISLEPMQTRIASIVSEVGFLDRYLRDRMMTRPGDYCDLNELAEKMDRMDEQQLRTSDGALNAESINGISDILHIADSLKDYIFVNGVTTEKELGRFLVDSGYKGFSESVKPYLDYAAIGTEYYAERGGAFTGSGYTLRRSNAEPMIAEQNKTTVFRVHLRTGGMRRLGKDPYVLSLPASDEQLRYAKDALNIEDFAEAAVIKVECTPEYLQGYLPLNDPDIYLLNEIAENLIMAWSGENSLKIMSVLTPEHSRPQTLPASGLVPGPAHAHHLRAKKQKRLSHANPRRAVMGSGAGRYGRWLRRFDIHDGLPPTALAKFRQVASGRGRIDLDVLRVPI